MVDITAYRHRVTLETLSLAPVRMAQSSRPALAVALHLVTVVVSPVPIAPIPIAPIPIASIIWVCIYNARPSNHDRRRPYNHGRW